MLTYKDLLLMGPEAVCITDTNMNIVEHNQNMSLLIGWRDTNLTGRNLSSVLCDDEVIHKLSEVVASPGWCQGECLLKTRFGFPLLVKFRLGLVAEGPGYVIVFRESESASHLIHMRRIKALRALLESISKPNMSPEDILRSFAKAYDKKAEVILLPPDFGDEIPKRAGVSSLLSKRAIVMAHLSLHKGTPTMCHDDNVWCFFPIRSRMKTYGLACIRFLAPYLCDDEDKAIFDLAGTVISTYIENFSSIGQPSLSHMFRIAFNSIKQGIIVVNRKGSIVMCNSAAQEIYGYTELEMIGKSFGELVFTADNPLQYNNILDRVMRGSSMLNEEMIHLRRDWTRVDVSVTAHPYTSDSGIISGAIFVVEDTKFAKCLQSNMAQWEKLSVLGELLSSAANELNNSLTSVIGYSQMLLQRKNNANVDNMAETIYEKTSRCVNIVRGLLSLAREHETQRGYSNVNDIVNAALSLKQYQLRANNIDVRKDLDENIPQTIADPHDVERLFLHIINYAERRMLEYNNGGQLTIETSFEKGNVVARFKDTGTCILATNFESSADEEIGVELLASWQVLQKIGARVSINSQIGRENVISIELPSAKVSSGIAEPRKFHSLRSFSAGHNGERETLASLGDTRDVRVMVVDDESDIVELLTYFLQQIGYIVDVAKDGNEAMEKLKTKNYDFIVSDLKMPNGFTGDKLHSFIKRRDPGLARRMIFITGDMVNSQTQRFLQSTGNPYLEKPFLPESLLKVIQELPTR